VAAAFIMRWGIFEILAAYLIGKTIAAWIVTSSAVQQVKRAAGDDWTRAPAHLLPDWRAITQFAVSTNINGTVNLFARDNIPLYIKYLLGDAALGYYNMASKFILFVTLPIDPFIGPTYAEITRTIAQRQWQATRRLLRQISVMGGAWTLLAGGGLAALGWWFIPFLSGAEYAPAYPCLVILLIGYGFANILNWNRPFLLALGHPNYPLMVAAVTGVIEIILIWLFAPSGGYLAVIAIFSGYLIVSISWNVLRGLAVLKQAEAAA
jgi:O-antigen/teichoic acid export membrane protein